MPEGTTPIDTAARVHELLARLLPGGRVGSLVAGEILPGTGAALLSLAAFQALGLSLTELPEVTVYGP